MKHLVLILALLVGVLGVQLEAQGLHGRDEPLPWPWGTECPFPWQTIEGYWEIQDESGPAQFFEFKVISVQESGSHVFDIRHYNEFGEMVAEGRGVSQTGQRIVRAALTSKSADGEVKSYWAIVRTYVEKEPFTCENSELVTVLTLRPHASKADEDIHYLIKKVEAGSCLRR